MFQTPITAHGPKEWTSGRSVWPTIKTIFFLPKNGVDPFQIQIEDHCLIDEWKHKAFNNVHNIWVKKYAACYAGRRKSFNTLSTYWLVHFHNISVSFSLQIDTIENLFPHSEGLTACPLLLVSESICEVEIEKPLPVTLEHEKDNEVPIYKSGDKTTTDSALLADSSEPLSLEASTAAATPETSGQSSVTYSSILLSDQPSLLRKQQESLSSSSDEGNFSANNSDISGSFPGGLWDLENHVCSDSANPRHSSSYNSVEEFSETSDQDYEASESTGVAKDLYYLEVNEEEEEDDEEEIEETQVEQEKNEMVMKVDARPLLEGKNSTAVNSNNVSHSIPLYLPQFRTECIINPPWNNNNSTTWW